MEKCLICSEKYKIMVSLQHNIRADEDLSVAQALQNLHFVTISPAAKFQRSICFICVSKIQSCYDFKTICGQIKEAMDQSTSGITVFDSTTFPFSSASHFIKTEKSIDNFDNFNEEKQYFNFVKIEPFSENIVEIPTTSSHSTIKPEIDGDEGHFVTEEINFSKPQPNIEKGKNPQERNFICTICEKGFKLKHHLRHHLLIHTGERPYVCNTCNKSFNQPSSLTLHKLIHTGTKHHVCDVCNKSFSQASHLISHKYIHTGERPYVCDLCDKTFNHSSTLYRHKLTHSGKKTYVCDVCSKSYTHFSSLYKHKLVHNGVRHVCNICEKSFKNIQLLESHKLIHGNRKSEAELKMINESI